MALLGVALSLVSSASLTRQTRAFGGVFHVSVRTDAFMGPVCVHSLFLPLWHYS